MLTGAINGSIAIVSRLRFEPTKADDSNTGLIKTMAFE